MEAAGAPGTWGRCSPLRQHREPVSLMTVIQGLRTVTLGRSLTHSLVKRYWAVGIGWEHRVYLGTASLSLSFLICQMALKVSPHPHSLTPRFTVSI